jgi:hypothetical protein
LQAGRPTRIRAGDSEKGYGLAHSPIITGGGRSDPMVIGLIMPRIGEL